MQNKTPNSNESKILQIVRDRGEEIYTKKEFIGLVMDYFPNDDFGRLLKTIIEKNGAVYVSKLKQYSGNELQINYVKLIDRLANETFIARDILTPAVDLLCFGLGLVLQTSTQKPIQTPNTVQKKKTTPAPTQALISLDDFNIVDGVLTKYIGSNDNVTIPSTITEIGQYAFKNCRGLTSVTIPNSVTTIEQYAFYECTSLTAVTIPNSVTAIEQYTFYECTSLTSVIIPNSLTTIEQYTFYECTSLTAVTIPNSVTTIEQYAFYECTSLTAITIPNSISDIGCYAFKGCKCLPENVKQQIKSISPIGLGY